MKFLKLWFYPCIFIAAFSIFLIHYIISGQAVYGDGIGYYAHVRSWVIDQSIDTTNEYKHLYTPQNNNSLHPYSVNSVQIVSSKKDGRVENFYGPGVGLFLLPFFLTADVLTQLASLVGYTLPKTGYSDIYQIFCGFGAIVYVIFGLYILEKLLTHQFKNSTISKITVFTLFFATQLLFYGSFDVINSHFASFFLSVVFFYVLFIWKNSSQKDLVLGVIAALATSVRLQDGATAFIWLVITLQKLYPFTLQKAKSLGKKLLFFLSGFFIAILPLLIHWIYTFGNISNHTLVRTFLLDMKNYHTIEVLASLFSPRTGLFSQTPLLLILFLFFLYAVITKKAKKYWILFLFFFIQFCIITLQGGFKAAAYGGRMYISSLVFFGFLLSDFLLFMKKRHFNTVATLGCILFILFNLYNMGNFILFEKEATDNKKGTEGYTQKRIQELFNKVKLK